MSSFQFVAEVYFQTTFCENAGKPQFKTLGIISNSMNCRLPKYCVTVPGDIPSSHINLPGIPSYCWNSCWNMGGSTEVDTLPIN